MTNTLLVSTIAFTVLTSGTLEQVCQKDICTGDTNNNEPRIYPELLGLDQEDPALIRAIKERVLIPPPPKKAKLNLKSGMSWEKLKGQFGQVELIVNEGETMGIDPNKKGFFVEAGASDGEEYSNTLYLEQKLKWTGLLVEANPDFVQDLVKKKRRSWILPHCLSIKNTSSVEEFDNISFWGGIVNKQDFPGSSMPGDIDREGLRFPPFMNRRTLQVSSGQLLDWLNPFLKCLNCLKGAVFSIVLRADGTGKPEGGLLQLGHRRGRNASLKDDPMGKGRHQST